MRLTNSLYKECHIQGVGSRSNSGSLTIDMQDIHSLHFGIGLNNHGVTCLQHGQIEEALECFHKALSYCWEPLRKNTISTTQNSDDSAKDFSEVYCNALLPQELTGLNDLILSEGFVHWRTLAIRSAMVPRDIHSFVFLSFVAMFNLALGHHWKGIATTCDFELRKAARLYELSHLSILEGGLQEDIGLILAIVNNLSRVFVRIGEEQQADTCCERVLAILVFIADQEDERIMPPALREEFLSNVCHLILRQSQTASAA